MVSTIVRNLEENEFLGYDAFWKSHHYYPLIKKRVYINDDMVRFFDGSYKNLALFFAEEEKLSAEALKEIISLIENRK